MMGAGGYKFRDWTHYHAVLQRQHALRHGYAWSPRFIALLSHARDVDEPSPGGPLWEALVDAVVEDAAGCAVGAGARAQIDELLRMQRGDLVSALVEHYAPCRRTRSRVP